VVPHIYTAAVYLEKIGAQESSEVLGNSFM